MYVYAAVTVPHCPPAEVRIRKFEFGNIVEDVEDADLITPGRVEHFCGGKKKIICFSEKNIGSESDWVIYKIMFQVYIRHGVFIARII